MFEMAFAATTDPAGPTLWAAVSNRWQDWGVILVVAFLSALVNQAQLWKQKAYVFSLGAWAADVVTSIFSAMIVAWACTELGVSPLSTLIAIAVGSHAGPRTIYLFRRKYFRLLDLEPGDQDPISRRAPKGKLEN